MPSKLSQIGEFGLIRQLQKTVRQPRHVIKGIGDDTAVLPGIGGKFLLFTTDMIAEGVHFTGSTPPERIGHKALACNISDIAAMGGVPTYAVISLGLPPKISVKAVQGIYKGINRLAGQFGVTIVGGDTILSQRLTINIALLGEVKKEHLVTRSGAKEGDWIFVTGTLGNSFKNGKHLKFVPRVAESQFLVKNCRPSAMLDISDGLAGDLGHILEESGVGAVLYDDCIPRAKGATLEESLYDGEDFELLFTLAPSKMKKMIKEMTGAKDRFHFYPIGQIVKKKEGLSILDRWSRRRTIKPQGFTHF